MLKSLQHWKLQLDKTGEEKKKKSPTEAGQILDQMSREVMGSPSLEIFVIQLPKAMGNLI